MPVALSCHAYAYLPSFLASCVSECSNRIDSFVGQSTIWHCFSGDKPVNSALTLGALIILIAFIMIPKRYWRHPSPAHTPDSSAPKPLSKEYRSEDAQLQKQTHRSRKFWWIILATSTVLLALILALSLGLTLGREHHGGGERNHLGAIVDLGYSQYQGDSYNQGVRAWLGVRYAAPPTGHLRFAAPQDPIANSTLQRATKVCSDDPKK